MPSRPPMRSPSTTGLVWRSATELSVLIHAREVSCVEVMVAHLTQIERHNPTLNAIVGMREPEALIAEAAERDAELAAGHDRGWLHGLPHAVKDLAEAQGLPFTCGSPIFADRIGVADELIVRRIRGAGAIIVGKTNTPEFGLGSQTYNDVWGTTGNPYDPSRTAGGSSGGAAVAVAARMLPVADGSDYLGSLRNPPAFTNVIGFRPSFGLIPEPGFVAHGAVNGAIGRTVGDVARLLATMAGPDPSAPLANEADPARLASHLDHDPTGTRIGWVGDWNGHLATEPGLLDLCESAPRVLAGLGCRVEPVTPPFDPEALWQAFLVWRWWANLALLDLYENPATRALLKPEAVWEVEHGLQLSAADLTRAAAVRDGWYATLAALFERFDYLLAPSAQVFPFDKAVHWPQEIAGRTMDCYHRWMETVAPWTFAGCPVAGMPAGFNDIGLPAGVQLIGRARDDHGVLRLARAYERATEWTARIPPAMVGKGLRQTAG